MICTEVAEMYEFVKKVIAPVGAAAILAALFYPSVWRMGSAIT